MMNATSQAWTDDQNRGANKGWIAGALVVVAVLVIGAAFWFSYHP
ncbi:MAG: hypothetical protein WA691_08310 [Thermoplasmata archaeon]